MSEYMHEGLLDGGTREWYASPAQRGSQHEPSANVMQKLTAKLSISYTHQLRNNPDVTGKAPLLGLLYNNFWGEPMDAFNAQHQSYRPLATLTFRWNYAMGGLEVRV